MPARSTASTSWRRARRWLLLALLAGLPLGFSLPGTYLQDGALVLASARDATLAELWTSYWTQGGDPWQLPGNLYRPLPLSIMALEDRLAGAAGVRFGNAVLHILNTLLLCAFLQRWLTSAGGLSPDRARRAATLGSAWFACHPALADASLFLVGKADLLVVSFFLLAALCLLAGRWVGTALCICLAALCKETGFFLAPLLVVLGLCRPHPAGLRSRLQKDAPLWSALALGLGLQLALRWQLLGRLSSPLSLSPLAGLDFWQRLPVVGRILFVDLQVWAFPIAPSTNFSGFLRSGLHGWSLPAVVGFAWVLALIGLAVWRRGGLAALVAICLLGLLPVSHLLMPIGAAYGNRFLYLPSLGVAGLLGLGLQRAWSQRRAAQWGMLAALACLTLLCAARADESRRPLDFWSRLQRRHPDDAKPALNAMAELTRVGQRADAISLGRALFARSQDPELAIGLGKLLVLSDLSAERLEGAYLIDAGVSAQPAPHLELLPQLRALFLSLDCRPDALRCVRLMLEHGGRRFLRPADAALAAELGDEALAARVRRALADR